MTYPNIDDSASVPTPASHRTASTGSTTVATATEGALTDEDYGRAMELWPGVLPSLVRNVHVAPHWIVAADGSERVWLREQVEGGTRIACFDAATGARLDGANLEPSSTPVDPSVLPGPHGRALFVRDANLWLREADGSERALTDDGVSHAAWGSWPEWDLRAVERSRGSVARPPFGVDWSPDGAFVLAACIDERTLEPYPYLESVPADGSHRPIVHQVRQVLAGERPAPAPRWQVIRIDDGTRVDLRVPDDDPRWRIDVAFSGNVFWRRGGEVVVTATTSNDDHVAVIAFDVASGVGRVVHEEGVATWFDTNTFQYSRPNLRLAPGGDALLWYSQADGWGHLYVLDLDRGGIARRLTEGPWAVQDVLAIADGAVFFTACGREPGRHPYFRHLYRVPLDAPHPNARLVLLTPEDADHPMSPGPPPLYAALLRAGPPGSAVSPSGRWFVDTGSTVTTAPITVLRDARDGRLVAELLRADVTALLATGWKPVEPFRAKAADGETDLFGVLVKPRTFDPSLRYPVVERIYGGPQLVVQPRNFAESLFNAQMYGAWSLAELGFVVVIVDGPGTPSRSKAFHDMPYGSSDRWGVAHHRAAIEGAAATRPWMDLSRVGLCGHSYGGYGTAMGLLLEPDFYRVGVSSAGMYDPMTAGQATPERHLGRPAFAPDRFVKSRPDEVAENYRVVGPSHYADRLRGRLMLAYGDLDENIQPAGALAFAAALIRAGKSFDLLCIPGANHGFVATAYFQKRLWDYFLEHLAGRTPLIHLAIDAAPGPRTII